MLRKLRVKFVTLTMTAVALVLAVVFTVICVLNYQQSTDAVYSALDAALSFSRDSKYQAEQKDSSDFGASESNSAPLANSENREVNSNRSLGSENDNSSPNSFVDSGEDESVSDLSANEEGINDTSGAFATLQQSSSDAERSQTSVTSEPTPPEIGGMREGKEPLIPVAVYSIKGESGKAVVEPGSATASIAEDILTQAIDELASVPAGKGRLDDLHLFYQKIEQDDVVYLAFADGSAADGWQFLALSLAGVGAVTLLVFFVISVFFSRWALKPVEQAWKQQQQFVADASHELKTPLTVILANSSILLAHPEQSVAQQNQWVESTQHEAERMQKLVNDMLLLARSDANKAGKLRGKTAAFGLSNTQEGLQESLDFSYVVEGQILQFESVAFEKGIQIEQEIAEDIEVRGKKDQMERLVSILLDNACKYAPENSIVKVILKKRENETCLLVNNQGTPISPDDLPHLFDRFYRVDKARVRTGGFGLGLAIAKDIVEATGGSISAESTETSGITFIVVLPLNL